MSVSGWTRGVLLALSTWAGVPGAAQAATQAPRADVARELAIRDDARSIGRALAALPAPGATWQARARALEALERALATSAAPPPLEPPAALAAAVDDAHPNVRAAALGALGREPAWARRLFTPERFAREVGGLLEETRLHAAEAALSALRAGASSSGWVAPALALAADGDADDRLRRAALGVLALLLGDPAARDGLLPLLRTRWAEDEALRAGVAAFELTDHGPQALAALAYGLDGEPGAVLAALAASRGASLEVARLLAHWPASLSDRARFESIRQAALMTAEEPALAALVDAAAAAADGDWLTSIVRAVGPDPLLAALPSATRAEALALLEGLGGPDVFWTEAQALAATVRRDLPGATLEALAGTVLLDDPATVAALAALLPDLSPEEADHAVRLLQPEHVTRHAAEVAAAWERAGRPTRWLDRFVDVRPAPPLRDGLLALARTDVSRAMLAPALARFTDDEQVVARLRVWFTEGLERWRARPTARAEADLAPIVAAYGRAAGEQAVGQLELALAEARGRAVLGRELVRACGRTEGGRRALALQLDAEGWESEALHEARVALLEAGRLPVAERARLLDDLVALPRDLQRRALAGLADDPDAETVGVLFAIAASPADLATRLRAVDALGRIGGASVRARLRAGFAAEGDYELRRAFGGALGAAGAVEFLVELLGILRAGRIADDGPVPGTWPEGFRPPAVEGDRERLADELAIELADLGQGQLEAGGGVLTSVADRAAELLERRFDRRPVEGRQLLLYAVLPTLGALREDPRLSGALEASGAWWRGDGLSLLACAQALAPSTPAARAVTAAADVALLGEPELERGQRVRAPSMAIDHARGAGDWVGCQRALERLLLEVLRGSLSRVELRQVYGAPWPAVGSHPVQQLRALELAARARILLDAGELEAGRALAARARSIPGAAGTVAEALGELEAPRGR